MDTQISEFTGKYEFLSNEFLAPVCFENQIYPSVAHAFQAARTSDTDLRSSIAKCADFQALYTLCEEMDNPADWQKQRLFVMERLIRDKFRRNRELQRRLLETGSKALINTYTDATVASNLFWGLVGPKGQNHVGNLLMKTRKDIETGREVEGWLVASFHIQTEQEELPVVRVTGYKRDRKVDREVLQGQAYYLVGTSSSCALRLGHPSISRKHACFFIETVLGPTLVDLHSKAGTFLNGQAVKQGVAVPINSGDEVSFGESGRTYRVEVDYGKVTEKLERRKRKLDEELKALEQVEQGGDLQSLKRHLGLPTSRTVYIQHLSYRCEEADLSQLLSVCGAISKVRIHRGRSHSSAYVKFAKPESAKNAVKYDGLLFQGKNIAVTVADRNDSSDSDSPSLNRNAGE